LSSVGSFYPLEKSLACGRAGFALFAHILLVSDYTCTPRRLQFRERKIILKIFANAAKVKKLKVRDLVSILSSFILMPISPLALLRKILYCHNTKSNITIWVCGFWGKK